MPKPNHTDYPEYFAKYISQVSEDDLNEAFYDNSSIIKPFLKSIPEEKWDFAYAEGKWSIKELVQHIIDAERIFAYRALCFARKDKTSLPSFDENLYAANSSAAGRLSDELIAELISVRTCSEMLFNSFNEDMLNETGVANHKPTTVLSIGFILIGHFNHHKRILEERYL